MLTEHTKRELKKLQGHLRANPQRFNMSYWLDNLDKVYVRPGWEDLTALEEQEPPACNTVACLAGEYLIMTGEAKYNEQHRVFTVPTITCIDDHVGLKLGITGDQADALFKFKSWRHNKKFGTDEYLGWPAELEREYLDARSHAERAAVAIRRIQLFIDSEGAI